MNPIDEYKKTYITASLTVAMIYAFVIGGSFSSTTSSISDELIFRISDGLIYGVLLCLAGIMLWNIFRFVIPTNINLRYRIIFIFLLALFTGTLLTAAESLAIYFCFQSLFGFFVTTIHIRLFVAMLFFIIIRLFFLFYHEKITSKTLPPDTTVKMQTNMVKSPIDRMSVRNGQKIIIISIHEIIFIKADGDYISINTAKGTWLKEQTMKDVENVLPGYIFVRIHRSYIVNINYISRIERYGEKQLIVLNNNEKIKVSSARYQILKQVLGL